MKLVVRLSSGNTFEVTAHWHPSCRMSLCTQEFTIPSGIYVTKEDLIAYNDSYNKSMKEMYPDTFQFIEKGGNGRTIKSLINLIYDAEAPFELIEAGDSKEPWKNFGNTIKSVPGNSDVNWKFA